MALYCVEKYCSYSNRVVSLVADLFERDFMLSFSENNQADAIEIFNSTSRYLMTFLILIKVSVNDQEKHNHKPQTNPRHREEELRDI